MAQVTYFHTVTRQQQAPDMGISPEPGLQGLTLFTVRPAPPRPTALGCQTVSSARSSSAAVGQRSQDDARQLAWHARIIRGRVRRRLAQVKRAELREARRRVNGSAGEALEQHRPRRVEIGP